ncbi:MAG: hypothetical protein IH881_18320 [Myxococcales bacterium]|nr:hypothetical protein [Myxococcales bacterium]
MAAPETTLLAGEEPTNQPTRLDLYPDHHRTAASEGTQGQMTWPQLVPPPNETPIHGLLSPSVIAGTSTLEMGIDDDEYLVSNSREARTSRDRVQLLARKHVANSFSLNELSTEEDARLLILTERIRKLVPSATGLEVDAMEKFAEDIETSKRQIEERDRKYRSAATD